MSITVAAQFISFVIIYILSDKIADKSKIRDVVYEYAGSIMGSAVDGYAEENNAMCSVQF